MARAWFAEKPGQELVRLDQLEIVRSPLSAPVDHARMAVLSFFAEVLDEALPEHDPQETVFRLLVSVLEQTTVRRASAVDAADLLFAVDDAADGPAAGLAHCTACGEALQRGGGLVSTAMAMDCSAPLHRNGNASGLSARLLATGAANAARAGFGLCRRAMAAPARPGSAPLHLQALERHLERKLRSAEALARLEAERCQSD